MFIYNPFSVVEQSAKRLYPRIKTEIQFNPTIKSSSTFINNDGVALIDIPTTISVEDAINSLIHELSHVAVSNTVDHKAEFNLAALKIKEQFEMSSKKIIEDYNNVK